MILFCFRDTGKAGQDDFGEDEVEMVPGFFNGAKRKVV